MKDRSPTLIAILTVATLLTASAGGTWYAVSFICGLLLIKAIIGKPMYVGGG